MSDSIKLRDDLTLGDYAGAKVEVLHQRNEGTKNKQVLVRWGPHPMEQDFVPISFLDGAKSA